MPNERPTILTVVAIIGIVLGSCGVLGGLLGLAGVLAQGALSGLEQAAELPEAQRQIIEQTNAIARAHIVPTMIASVANVVTSILLIVGGALLLTGKPVALGLMMKTVIAAVVVDVYSTALAVYMQFKTMPLTEQMMRASTAGMPPGADAAMGSVMSAAAWFGAVFTVFWLLVKLGYYIVAIIALKKPAVKAWFAERAAA